MIHVQAAVLAVMLAACGGNSTPLSSPGPTPDIPAASACDSLGLKPSLGIVNGVACSADRSAVVLLNMRSVADQPLGACSGTIIAPRAILTAAHCLDGDVGIVRVWLGSGSEIVAESFEYHPSYVPNSGTALDVGVVFMAEDLPRTPVPILASRDARVGETVVLAGWGRDQQSVGATLRAGTATISAVGSIFLETLHTTNASSICLGDSGGPLLLQEGGRWAVAGISSAATVATCNTGTNFYVNVRNPTVASYIVGLVPEVGQR